MLDRPLTILRIDALAPGSRPVGERAPVQPRRARYLALAISILVAAGVAGILGWWTYSSTTLADLLTPQLVANPFSAVLASPQRWWLSEEFEDGLAYGRQAWLRWWPVDSFFSALLF